MPYLVEFEIKFPIDWHSNLEIFIFGHFLQKKPDYKKMKKFDKK